MEDVMISITGAKFDNVMDSLERIINAKIEFSVEAFSKFAAEDRIKAMGETIERMQKEAHAAKEALEIK